MKYRFSQSVFFFFRPSAFPSYYKLSKVVPIHCWPLQKLSLKPMCNRAYGYFGKNKLLP